MESCIESLLKPSEELRCYGCGRDRTYVPKNRRPRWVHNYDADNNALCLKCYRYIFCSRRKERVENPCYACGSITTYVDKKGYAHWCPNNDEQKNRLCSSCYFNILVGWDEKRKERQKRRKERVGRKEIQYKGKRVWLKENPRCYVCNWCRAVVGQIDAQTGKKVTRTVMHHTKYDDKDITKHTIEVCIKCHLKEHAQIDKNVIKFCYLMVMMLSIEDE